MNAPFAASASALGYLYQLRYALLLLLEAGADAELRVEWLDDVEYDIPGVGKTLHQLKLHKKGIGDLSDSSGDLWKTLRVWSEQVASGHIVLPGTALTLVTSAKAPKGSVAALLGVSNRDPDAALVRLNDVARASKNKALAASFKAFRSLTRAKRLLLVEAVTVLDASPNIIDTSTHIRKRVMLAAHPDHVGALYERLEGWWLDLVIRQLSKKERPPITHASVHLKIADIAEQLHSDSLPIDFASAVPSIVDAKNDERMFVRQLRALEISLERIEVAILDYYRAYEQRSRWVREQLILDEELSRYEGILVDDWRRASLALTEALGKKPSQSALRECGRKIYHWMEFDADLPIRSRVTAGYVMRGSFHMLADEKTPRVWWHPQFVEKLKKVLQLSE